MVGEVYCLALIGARLKREFRVLYVKSSQGAGQRTNGIRLSRLEKLQSHSNEPHSKKKPSPYISCHGLRGEKL